MFEFVKANSAAKQMEEWAKPKSQPKKKSVGASSMDRAMAEVRTMLDAGVWREPRALHFVALYAILHEAVYKVLPVDLGATARLNAARLAGTLYKKHFDEEPPRMVAFMHWVWRKERRDEQKRRAGAKSGTFRITWRYQFSDKLVADYFVACAQMSHRETR